MKKKIIMVAFTAMALLLAGCDLMGTNDDESPSAPNMGSASELPASGATSSPSTPEEAETLFLEAVTTLNSGMSSPDVLPNLLPKTLLQQPNASVLPTVKNSLARSTQPIDESLDEVLTIGGGTITLKGSAKGSETELDASFQPTANTTYNDLLKAKIDENLTGTVDDVTLPVSGDPTYTYTYNGKFVSNGQLNENIDVIVRTDVVGFSDASWNIDLSGAIQEGYAFSIKRSSDGKGGKFILSYAFDFSYNDIDISMDDEGDFIVNESDLSDLSTKLGNTMMQLKVYDDSDTLLYTINLPLSEMIDTASLIE